MVVQMHQQHWKLRHSRDEVCNSLPFFSAFIFLLSSLFLAGGVFVAGAGAEGAAGAGGSEAVGLETCWMLGSAEGTDTSFTVKNKSNDFTALLQKKTMFLWMLNAQHNVKIYLNSSKGTSDYPAGITDL